MFPNISSRKIALRLLTIRADIVMDWLRAMETDLSGKANNIKLPDI